MNASVLHEFDQDNTFIVDLDNKDSDGEPRTIIEIPSIENGGTLPAKERIRLAKIAVKFSRFMQDELATEAMKAFLS